MGENGSVIAVLEFCPDTPLSLSDVFKVGRGSRVDGSSCDGCEKTCAKEDGEDSEVLGGVVDGDKAMAGTKGVLDTRTEVEGERHIGPDEKWTG